MSLLYADYNCPGCGATDKLMYEVEDEKDKVVLAGQMFTKETRFINECAFCKEFTDVIAAVREKTFLGFLNSSENKKVKEMSIPKTDEILGKWKREKIFAPTLEVEFGTQPFPIGEVLDVGTHRLRIKKVFRAEWVEKDMELRLENPIPDAYWYEVVDQDNKKRWMKVENTEGDNVTFNESGIVLSNEKEIIEEMSVSEPIEQIFKMEWFGGRNIEAYQYKNGVRLIVIDYKNTIEMDLFNDTLEEVMQALEDNTELGVFNE